MKKLLIASLLMVSACTLPLGVAPTATPTQEIIPTAVTAIPLQPTAQPGTEANPIILALAPAAHPTVEDIQAGETLAARLESLTGYQVVTIAPASEQQLIQAMALGNAQVGLLTPFGYLLARKDTSVTPLLSRVRDGQSQYGAQFIARIDAGFKSYYDAPRGENTAEAAQALGQFSNRKPCWSDMASPSGYVVPLGILKEAGVTTRDPAFLEGQPTVVRAVYGKGICDFGATYIDARLLPGLEADYPDVLEKVLVIWQIPPVIPYETIVASSSLNPEIQRALLRAFIDIMNTTDGKLLIQKVYGLDAIQPAEDSLYHQFGVYVDASGLDLNTLIK
jgi:phosphonate transport system substrate-binding protein